MLRLPNVASALRLPLAVMVYLVIFGNTTGWAGTNRVALVIGNGAYQKVPALPNATRDAGDVTHAPQQLGFNARRCRQFPRPRRSRHRSRRGPPPKYSMAASHRSYCRAAAATDSVR
jgi:hypothetical protein